MTESPAYMRRAMARTATTRDIVLAAFRGYDLPAEIRQAKLAETKPAMRLLIERELNFLTHIAEAWPFPFSHWADEIDGAWTVGMAMDVVLERYRATDTLDDFDAWLIRHTDYWPAGQSLASHA